jgi:chromosome segregation ATPase
MALTATAMQRGGWQNQARRLALAPMAAVADFAAADETPRRLSLIQPADCPPASRYPDVSGADVHDQEAPEPVDPAQQLAIKTTVAKMLIERTRKLLAAAAAKDKRIAELEDALLAGREDIVYRDNESRSLQTSLDLVTGENARLSDRLRDSADEAGALKAQLENSRAALLAAQAERDRLAVANRESVDLHRIESDALNDRLDAMTSRNAATERLLVDVRKCLAARIAENGAAARQVADATLAKDAADRALGQLHDSLELKEHQVEELEQSRAMLLAGAGTLLETFETRIAALAEAEARANSLAARIAEAEANSALAESKVESLNLQLQSGQAGLVEAAETIKSLAKRVAQAEANSALARSTIERLNLHLQNEQASRVFAELALNKAQTNYSGLRRELDNVVKRGETLAKPAAKPATEPATKPAVMSPAESLLAATISF